MAIYSNLTVDQGSTFGAEIDVTDSSGDPLDLNGYTVEGQLRKTYTSTTSTPFTSSVFNASGGVVKIALSATTTNALKAGRYVYDVEITKTSTSEITRIIEGQLEVRPGVTRA
jgi:hypothetical protein|tara:strand:- start:614 stop:952 length:339 start_codon:yes stop_codon:yes gene_type:complete